MASARLRNNRWAALFRDAQGKQKSAGTFATEKEALKAAEHAEAVARPPKTTEVQWASRRGKPTMAGYGPGAIAGARLEATSRENYRLMFGKHVAPALGSKTPAELTPADIRAFARKLESSGLSSSAAHLVMCVLKLVVKTALQDGLIPKDVTAGISVQRKGRSEKVIATPAQAKAIEAAFDQHYRLMIRAMFETGARYGEILGLQAGDVCDRPGGGKVIKVRRTIAEYGGKVSVRPYGRRAVPRVTSRSVTTSRRRSPPRARRTRTDGCSVTTGASASAVATSPACGGSRATPLAFLDTPHGARHSLASWLANDPSVPLVAVRDMLGHA